jgi:hypothetical protein
MKKRVAPNGYILDGRQKATRPAKPAFNTAKRKQPAQAGPMPVGGRFNGLLNIFAAAAIDVVVGVSYLCCLCRI